MNNRGFSLMELVTVVIIVGIIAAFAIPNYKSAVERTHLKDATANLIAIHSAQKIKFSEDNTYYPETATTETVANINANLRLQVIEQGVTYACTGVADGSTFICDATRSATPAWVVRATEAALSSTNPQCISGTDCP